MRSMMWSMVRVAAVVAVLARAALGQPLNDDVQKLITGAKLGKDVKIGVSIIDPDTGEVLAALRAREPLTPASNMKVLTSGAALMTLGPDFVFKTELILDGDRLILRGDGDPALGDPEILDRARPKMTVSDLLEALSKSVKAAGIDSVREVIVDDGIFDRVWTHPDWLPEHLTQTYGVQTAGLNFHANVITIFAAPSKDGAGRPPALSRQPDAPWIEIDTTKARTVANGGNTLFMMRMGDSNQFQLGGEVRTQLARSHPLNNVPMFAGQLLADHLAKQGVRVGAGKPAVQSVRLAEPLDSAVKGRVLAVITTPIADVLKRCNSDSENLYAECLLKRTAYAVTKEPGSWTSGAAVMRMLLSQKLGPEHAASTTVSDGSGLSRLNLVAPVTLTEWMRAVARDPKIGPIYIESMAKPGEGTFRSRWDEYKLRGQLRGKSGFIREVRCLSGFVTNPATGKRAVFAVMINGLDQNEHRAAMNLQNEIVVMIDRRLTPQARATTRTRERQGG